MASFVDGEIGEVDEEKVGSVERGVKEKESEGDEPGDAGWFGDGFPVAEIVGGHEFGERGHEESVAADLVGERIGVSRVSRRLKPDAIPVRLLKVADKIRGG